MPKSKKVLKSWIRTRQSRKLQVTSTVSDVQNIKEVKEVVQQPEKIYQRPTLSISSTSSYTSASLFSSESNSDNSVYHHEVQARVSYRPPERITIGDNSNATMPPPSRNGSDFRTVQILEQKNSGIKPNEQMQSSGLVESILDTDADVIVLHEHQWYDSYTKDAELRLQLETQGYSLYCGTVFAPIAVATSLPVERYEEVCLDSERSALLLQLNSSRHDKKVWLCAFNLCDYDEDSKIIDMQALMEWINQNLVYGDRIVLAGMGINSHETIVSLQNNSFDMDDEVCDAADTCWSFSRNLGHLATCETHADWSYMPVIVSDWVF
jgi:hypothetical protein